MYQDALVRLANSKADASRGRKAPRLRLEEQWWELCLQDGMIPGMLLGDRILTSLALKDAHKRIPKLRYMSDRPFGHFLQKQGCLTWRTNSGVRGWILPPLKEARREWEWKYGLWIWNDPDLMEWQVSE